MKPVLYFVSANDDERGHFLECKKVCSLELDWHMVRSPEELFEVLAQKSDSQERVIVVGAGIEGIGQLNFVDAVRTHDPDSVLVPILQGRDSDTVNRAMMAGASAALAPTWSAQDLETLLKRVLKTCRKKNQTPQKCTVQLGKPTNISSIFSAKGGVGKSTLTAMLAYRFARAGKNVAVVDCDIQFGDMQLLFGISVDDTLFGALDERAAKEWDISAFGVNVSENISLFSFGQTPERIELLYGKVASLLHDIAQHFDVVLVNTGSFWTLFQFEIIEASSENICVTNQSIVSTRATRSLLHLCQKMGVPTTQFLYVVNDMHPYGLGSSEIAEALSLNNMYSVDHINKDFNMFIDAGNCGKAYDVFIQEETQFDSFARNLAQKMNLSLADVDAFQASMRKNPWWRLR